MDTIKAIKSRASVREYSSKPVEKQTLEKLVDAARLAPSARSVEPCDFIVIKDRARLGKISEIAINGAFIKNAQAAIVVVAKDTKYYIEDGCAATENILISASDLGLGACWIAGDKKPYADTIIDMLNCPKQTRLVSIISLGYPKDRPVQRQARPLDDVIHWESF
jgi:nitroreductase